MFPVSDVIPSRRTPVVTVGLIVFNAGVFLYELLLDDDSIRRLVDALGVTPADFLWHTAFTSLFLHAGWLQAAANTVFLWLFGDNVEDAFGRLPFLLFYLFCGTAAAFLHAVVHSSSLVPLIGASGAVAGVMGAYLVLYPRSRVLTAIFVGRRFDLVEVPAVFFMSAWFAIQMFSRLGSIGTIAADGALTFWAHVSGFLAGALCGAVARFGSLRRYWHDNS